MLMAGAVAFAILAPTAPASAATTWHCFFGPSSVTDIRTQLTFRTSPGVGNDSVTFRGEGTCLNGARDFSCSRFIVFCFRTWSAFMYGGDSDLPESSAVELGRCDADPPVYGGILGIPHSRILLIIGNNLVRTEFGMRTIESANPPWPGPLETTGNVYDTMTLNSIGSMGISSRIGGQCPPAGNSQAFYRLTITLP
jgi:hypothetical protein